MITTSQDFLTIIDKLGRDFAARAASHDATDEFVAENFRALIEHKVFSACVPQELGGGGVSFRQMSDALVMLGRSCGSTALSLSMHQHLIAMQVWGYKRGNPGKEFLEAVAANELVLVTTAGHDWLSSNGEMTKVDGGFRVSARKPFSSGCPAGSILMSSAPYEHPSEGWQVLHFGVPLPNEGVRIEHDWHTMGMRGTGSNSVTLENLFVPEDSVKFVRPRGKFHPVLNVIAAFAVAHIISVYVGIAEAAAAIARERSRKRVADPALPYVLGEMENSLATAQMTRDSLLAIVNEYDVEPVLEVGNAVLIRKSIATRACIDVVEKAMEATGGAGYFRALGLERLLRDVRAGAFHPLPEKKQHLFTGRVTLGLDPAGE